MKRKKSNIFIAGAIAFIAGFLTTVRGGPAQEPGGARHGDFKMTARQPVSNSRARFEGNADNSTADARASLGTPSTHAPLF
jgi:hypothetical protein